ncbi:hypothetical protein AC1031_010943 [Aphanomyces cochlioides]|nr:hypothetical protein AC1031_010943 [Aphanomyces cochlioides]
MKVATTIAYLSTALVAFTTAQLAGTVSPEVHPSLSSKTCTASGCTTENTKIVLDANWRWTHNATDYNNCFTGTWDAKLCPDPVTCAKNCALEGVDYVGTYGIMASGNQVGLRLVTKGLYGDNIGSRIYLLEDDRNYKLYQLLNKEFAFDVDVSQLPCGMNAALYFVQMEKDGGVSKYPTNKAGAAYGTGYCDAQCPHDVKFINGEANVKNWTVSEGGAYGSCCPEMDIWESNSISQAYTSHPCKITGQYRCTNPVECGDTTRYSGVCDKDGCDFNPYRMNNHTFYGPGSKFAVDSTKPVTVVTQFITGDNTANGNLVEVRRFYVQNGKKIDNSVINWKGIDPLNSLTDKVCSQAKSVFGDFDDHAKKGGLKAMGVALKAGVVLTMSLWTDHTAHCLWLDSTYPVDKNASLPGVGRGSCPITSGVPSEVESKYPNATVKYSNIRVGDLWTTTSVGTPSPTTKRPTPVPTTTKATPVPTTKPTTTIKPTTSKPSTVIPTTTKPPTIPPTTSKATSHPPTTVKPTTLSRTTSKVTTRIPTTPRPSSFPQTTSKPTTLPPTTTMKPSTLPPTTVKPTVRAWGQCGGNNHVGPTTCISGFVCKASSEWYSQCIPN